MNLNWTVYLTEQFILFAFKSRFKKPNTFNITSLFHVYAHRNARNSSCYELLWLPNQFTITNTNLTFKWKLLLKFSHSYRSIITRRNCFRIVRETEGNVFIRLLLSLSCWPKVILISGSHCDYLVTHIYSGQKCKFI